MNVLAMPTNKVQGAFEHGEPFGGAAKRIQVGDPRPRDVLHVPRHQARPCSIAVAAINVSIPKPRESRETTPTVRHGPLRDNSLGVVDEERLTQRPVRCLERMRFRTLRRTPQLPDASKPGDLVVGHFVNHGDTGWRAALAKPETDVGVDEKAHGRTRLGLCSGRASRSLLRPAAWTSTGLQGLRPGRAGGGAEDLGALPPRTARCGRLASSAPQRPVFQS